MQPDPFDKSGASWGSNIVLSYADSGIVLGDDLLSKSELYKPEIKGRLLRPAWYYNVEHDRHVVVRRAP